MIMLVSLQEALDHLHIDIPELDEDSNSSSAEETDFDGKDDLILKIGAASKAIIRYLGECAENVIEYDSDDEVISVDDDVKIATLLLIGELFKNRESSQGGEVNQVYGYGYLPRPVISLLYPLRDPVIG